ncbi:Man1-Src1p-C-terminal domain-containing protein [Dichotomocladium elegans]|nr:Man1-Src1p-C-terminal domain-containing protein [Dichotomocladium elegans]
MADDAIPNELYYLDPDFSPRSLRRYQLKTILKLYNIDVPPSARRAELVKLFQQHVESRREQILAEYKAEHETGGMSKKLGRGFRRSTAVRHAVTEEEKNEPLQNTVKSKRPVQQFQKDDSKRHEHGENSVAQDESGFAVPQVPESWYRRRHKISKRSSKLDDTPKELHQHRSPETKVTSEEHDIKLPSFTAQDSFASSDEDISLPQRRIEMDDRRRLSTKKIPRDSRKFTAEDSFASSEDDIHLPQKIENTQKRRSLKTNHYPINSSTLGDEPIPNTVKPDSKKHFPKRRQEKAISKHTEDSASDESYTADSSGSEESDEEMELDQELAPTNIPGDEVKWLVEDIAKHGSISRDSLKIVRVTYKILLALTLVTTIVVVGARYHNGYCSSESVQLQEQQGETLPNFFALPGLCIPCPDHGVCIDGQLECPAFFSRHHRWYNVGGMLPLADECIRDSATGRIIAKAEKSIKRELARRQGNGVCQHFASTGSSRNSALVKTKGSDLYKELLTKDFAYVTDAAKMEVIVSEALKSIMDDPRVHYWDLDGIPYYGTDAMIIPVWCSLYMAYSTIPVRTRWIMFAILISAFATLYGRHAYTLKQRAHSKTEKQVAVILSKLQEQLNRHTEDPDNEERGYAVSQLRAKLVDHNSSDSLAEWMRVVQAIKKKPQVRRGYREIGGEVCEYWELAV